MSITEAELAAAGAAHLVTLGYVVSQEVVLESSLRAQTNVGLGRADIVAQKGAITLVLEAKLSLSWDLYAQSKRWRELANSVVMLVPQARESDGRILAFEVARRFGLGVWELAGNREIHERVSPLIRDSIDPELVQSIRPEHQDGRFAKAGQSGGSNLVTPGNLMEAELAAHVAAHPGCKIEEAVPHIKHVFRRSDQAVEFFTKRIRKGAVPGVYRGQFQCLFPTREWARLGHPPTETEETGS